MYVLIADHEASDYKKALEAEFPDITFHAVTAADDIKHHAEKVDIIITIFRIPDQVLKQAANLKWVQLTTSGVNYLIDRPSLGKDVIVTSGRGIHGPQMSEMAILLMLALNRNFQQVIRNQDQKIWERWPAKLLYHKKIGILGIGVIGEEIARKCKAFDMTVYGMDIVKRQVNAVDFFHGPEDLPDVAKEVDYLVLVAPSTPETQKIVNAQVIASMKSTAFLINIGRGDLVDEEALIEALEAKRIAGAALDAMAIEPLPKDSPLWGMKNVIISPHVGGMSDIYREQVMPIIRENLRRFLQGERRNLINYVER